MFSYSCVTPIIQIIQIIHFLYSITRYIDMQQIERNPEFGNWTEEETNWSDKDTAFMDEIIKNSSGSKPTSLKELKDLHNSLSY